MPKPRKNERLRSIDQQMVRSGYQVIFRGHPTLIGFKPGSEGKKGDLLFVWMRRKRKTNRGGPLAGLTTKQKTLIKIFQDQGLKVSIL